MKKLLSAFLCALILFGCSEDVTTEETTGNIVGSVVDKSTGEPVPVVSVRLTENGKTTITGTDGVFEFKSVEPGKYTIKATKEGYNPGENTVSVASGGNSECHILIERIPAVITADRNELDFGSNYSTNTMSFNIVNNNYQTLGWKIVNNCGWIDKVEPASGELEYGKTGTIIVKIDRDALADGVNEAILVLSTTGNGSTEVKVKATGQAQRLATLNTLKMGDITASTAVFNGEIVDVGYPEYTERGFVYSEQQQPNENNTIQLLTSTVTKDATFSQQAVGLTLGKTYYVRAYARNKAGIAYSTNQVSFMAKSTPPSVVANNVSDVDAKKASVVANGEITYIGDPAYTEKGFVYGTSSTPTIVNTKVQVPGTNEGKFQAQIENLERDVTYYLRAYVVNSQGTYYSSDDIRFSISSTSPVVTIADVNDIDVTSKTAVLNGSIVDTGIPAFTECGFVYGFNSNPVINDYKITTTNKGVGDYSVKVDNLELNKQYYVRAYAINEYGISYSSTQTTFSLATQQAQVEIADITNVDIDNCSALLNGEIVAVGTPAYTECGFVYNTFGNPMIQDNKIEVKKSGTGSFSAKCTELKRNTTYYVRAYAINEHGISYSSTQATFSLATQQAQVEIADITNVDIDNCSALLNGEIVAVGTPAYTECGFVYNTFGNPMIQDNKIEVKKSGTGSFSAKCTELKRNTTYYVRAYAINEHGISYSATQKTLSLSSTNPVVTMGDVTDIIYSTASATFNGLMTNVGKPKFSERGFVYSTVTNPNIYHNKLVASSSNDTFQMSIIGLTTNTMYYVKAYAIQGDDIFYSDNEVNFSINATLPEVYDLRISNIDYQNRSALLTANITSLGDPEMSEMGFVYGTSTNPNIDNDTKISLTTISTGEYSRNVTNLIPNTIYHVRAYAKNEGGIAYSNEETFTLTYTTPTFSSVSVDNTNLSDGTAIVRCSVTEVGNPAYTERGFVYATHNSPTIADNHITIEGCGIDAFSGKLDNLELNRYYYVKAYVKTEIGYYYSIYARINTAATTPSIYAPQVSNIDLINRTAIVQGHIHEKGNPPYIERGFVYSEINDTPTINDNKIVIPGVDTEPFIYTLTDLKLDTQYYVRTYAISKAGTYYSGYTREFSTQQTLPAVKTAVVNENFGTKSAIFTGQITNVGYPEYTEVGFVYSTTNTLPDINDTKCVASEVSNKIFTYNASNLPSSGPIYVRAYAINQKGVAYADNVVMIFDPAFVIYDGYVEIPDLNLAIVYDDLGKCQWDAAKTLCSGLNYGGYTNWRLPTIAELSSISAYSERLNFHKSSSGDYYWSSEVYNIDAAYVYSFRFKSHTSEPKTDDNYVCAIRTLK